MYILWRYLHFIQEAQRRNDVRAEGENENNNMRSITVAGETTLDADIFRDLARESPIKLSHFSGIIMRNDDTAKGHERLKTIGEILETVSKSYHARALVDESFAR